MARCQHLVGSQEDSYEGGPSMNHCSELLAISPIYHISERGFLTGMKYQ